MKVAVALWNTVFVDMIGDSMDLTLSAETVIA
jgi:hypothetical protein